MSAPTPVAMPFILAICPALSQSIQQSCTGTQHKLIRPLSSQPLQTGNLLQRTPSITHGFSEHMRRSRASIQNATKSFDLAIRSFSKSEPDQADSLSHAAEKVLRTKFSASMHARNAEAPAYATLCVCTAARGASHNKLLPCRTLQSSDAADTVPLQLLLLPGIHQYDDKQPVNAHR